MEINLKKSILSYKLNNKSGMPVGQILCLWGSRPKLIFEFNDYHQNMLEDTFVNLNFCLNELKLNAPPYITEKTSQRLIITYNRAEVIVNILYALIMQPTMFFQYDQTQVALLQQFKQFLAECLNKLIAFHLRELENYIQINQSTLLFNALAEFSQLLQNKTYLSHMRYLLKKSDIKIDKTQNKNKEKLLNYLKKFCASAHFNKSSEKLKKIFNTSSSLDLEEESVVMLIDYYKNSFFLARRLPKKLSVSLKDYLLYQKKIDMLSLKWQELSKQFNSLNSESDIPVVISQINQAKKLATQIEILSSKLNPAIELALANE